MPDNEELQNAILDQSNGSGNWMRHGGSERKVLPRAGRQNWPGSTPMQLRMACNAVHDIAHELYLTLWG
ncbi:MAG: hypothetical protein DWQ34_10035 [Planctomycetota bacterium]|nr:MAG: hypothetical protein DWQ34_10035 [Planctomycetota bacterium]REK21957.1 MAG: hypothetical protein DWQ41_20420 [Planctomycetota bacterium]REK32131.1 MAG: hypothetical protein DWQ45_17375 [Planctomycetota bacterium]